MYDPLYYDYTASKTYCDSIGLIWLGNDRVRSADADAFKNGFTQEQVNVAMRHHLWNVLWLFTPGNYSWKQRIAIALYFLMGWKRK